MTTTQPIKTLFATTSIDGSKRSSRSTRPTKRSSATRSTSTSSPTRSAPTTRTSSMLTARRRTSHMKASRSGSRASSGPVSRASRRCSACRLRTGWSRASPPASGSPRRAGDKKLQVLLKAINEKIPTHAVIFDVSTDRGIRSGNQTLTEIMYGLFLQSLGYAKDLDLSELEIGLEEKGQLERFEEEYQTTLRRRTGPPRRARSPSRSVEASRVLHSLDPGDVPDGRFLGEGRQEQGGHHARQARRARQRADEAPSAWAARSCSSSTRSASSSPATSRRCSTCRPSCRASA